MYGLVNKVLQTTMARGCNDPYRPLASLRYLMLSG